MKRITCFTESLCGGGAEHQMVILAGLLAEEGYEVTIVTYANLPDYYDTPPSVRRIEIGRTPIGGALKTFVKILRCFHYFLWVKTDCIISYRGYANLRVLPPMFFRSRKSIKVICSDRNTSTFVSFKHKLLLNFLYKRADYIVPNSKTQTDFIISHKPQLQPKLRTIHNYTDLQQFVPSNMPTETSVIKVVIFARYSPQKNPIGLAKAIYELKNRTTRPFEVHWYGTQKNEKGDYNHEYLTIKKAVEELSIEEVFILHPAVKNPALLMNDYHAACLASIKEGFSNSIAEGICCGKPMLVSDVSDNSQMVHDGENGFLFDPKQTDSIVEAFMKFFSLSHEEMCRMGQRSREIAEELFDKKHFIQQYVDLIES